MSESIEQKLSGMPTVQLVKIILAALDTMGETAQINFIAKHIDAQTSLTRLGEDDPEAFIDEVHGFCMACLNGEYYSDEDEIEEYFSNNEYADYYYDDGWDYDEYFRNTEWAETFSRLFQLSEMYIQSGDFSIGFEATSRLLSCLIETKKSDQFFGTNDPDDYIDVNWLELFSMHYDALFQYHTDLEHAIEMAFLYWKTFGEKCTEEFLLHVKDISIAERCILKELKNANGWKFQRQCFNLLEQLYDRLKIDFDKASIAKKLLETNTYFHLFIVEGYHEQENWQAVVKTAIDALTKILMPSADSTITRQVDAQHQVRAGIQTMLADAYKNLEDYMQAFNTMRQMFQEAPDYKLYVRARALAEKTVGVSVFLEEVESLLSDKTHKFFFYVRSDLLIQIYSYEGKTKKLLDIAQSQEADNNYYHRKYIALSLIYRAIDDKNTVGESLSKYLTSPYSQDGIEDMHKLSSNTAEQTTLLLSGSGLLKGMIAFHIGAATRKRYVKAAYYMCVIRDIYKYLKKENEFKNYFSDIIMQNSRRPALRDEMSIVLGKNATTIKK